MTEADAQSPRGLRAGSQAPSPLRLGVFGAPLDTGNLGVSALGISTLCGLAGARERLELSLFDYGVGERAVELMGPQGCFTVRQLGCADSRRIWRPGNLRAMSWCARLGLRGLHPMLRRFGALHGLLDISGGDSFTDLYGAWRFRAITRPKRLALDLGIPLVLLPQTYGPYTETEHRSVARDVIRGARQAWARDARSFQTLRDVLGDAFDPTRHRLGVDVAFGLPARAPSRTDVAARLRELRAQPGPLLGLNASGLLWNAGASRAQFGLRGDYTPLLRELLERLLALEGARVVLVPHVVPPCAPEESDVSAAEALRAGLAPGAASRVWIAPALDDPREVKWLIGQLDWLCATRMHACIAALSQAVPTLGIAYSDKALGVFESAGAGDALLDARAPDASSIPAQAAAHAAARARASRVLREAQPRLRAALDAQFRSIVDAIG